MLRSDLLVLALAVACPLTVATVSGGRAEPAADALATTAVAFVAHLDDAQRDKACFAFDDAERRNWQFVPGRYPGIELGMLDAEGRRLAHRMLAAALSRAGYLEATSIMRLEQVLRDMARARGADAAHRDPERYSFAVFGTPGDGAWGFRVQGHHLSANWTVLPDGLVTVTPRFLGANPHEVREGPFAGLRVLGAYEDTARDVVAGLTDTQRAAMMLADEAPADILVGPGRSADLLGAPRGVPATTMAPAARAALERLLALAIDAATPDVAAQVQRRMNLDTAFFGWMGSTAPGEPHYFRVHAPGFALEYDNTQDGANHSHIVLHDLRHGFGDDLLQRHLTDDHGKGR